MNIIGISGFFHDSACCLLKDGELVAAASEERFSRIKNDARLPVMAFRYCLEAGGLDVGDIDAVAYYEDPAKKLSRQLWMGIPREVDPTLSWLDAQRPLREIREVLGVEAPIKTYDHHLSHAAGSFYYSGFEDAAILTVDAVGEWATSTYAVGEGRAIRLLDEVQFPSSVGLFYSTLTSYLGFKVLSGEYKVMGLAPYGQPRFVEPMRRLISPVTKGQFTLDLRYFDFTRKGRMFTDELAALFGLPPRAPESEITQAHCDVARSLQVVFEEVLLAQVAYLRERCGSPNLCMSGGAALNCVANGRILREGPFERLFVQPAAGDAGSALGAAALAHVELTGARHTKKPLAHAYLGPRYDSDDIAYLLAQMGIAAADYRGREQPLLAAVAERLDKGEVVGWFQGAMEFGPRALGARSLLATPRDPRMRERLNRLVKKREAFRPFAPVILAEHAAAHLDLDHPSPFMLETCAVRSPLDLPAVTHVDGSCRPQTVHRETNARLHALLHAFHERTGCPILVNTSFNVRGEPIVCSPMDALRCFAASDIDCLVLQDFLIPRDALDPRAGIMAEATRPKPAKDVFTLQDTDAVYTFI